MRVRLVIHTLSAAVAFCLAGCGGGEFTVGDFSDGGRSESIVGARRGDAGSVLQDDADDAGDPTPANPDSGVVVDPPAPDASRAPDAPISLPAPDAGNPPPDPPDASPPPPAHCCVQTMAAAPTTTGGQNVHCGQDATAPCGHAASGDTTYDSASCGLLYGTCMSWPQSYGSVSACSSTEPCCTGTVELCR